MVKKLGISIPDSLYEKIQEVKGEFKISQVCQEALAKAVEYALLRQSQDMEVFNKKLQEEKMQHYKKYYDEGFQEGTKHAFTMTYTDVVDYRRDIKEGIHFTSLIECYCNDLYKIIYGDEFDERFENNQDARMMYLEGLCDAIEKIVNEASI